MNGLQQVIYDASRVLLWPVLIAALACLVWVLIEFGFFLYELYLRFRYRDLDALEARTGEDAVACARAALTARVDLRLLDPSARLPGRGRRGTLHA